MKKVFLIILIALIIILEGCSSTPSSATLDTPEKAVSAYVAAIAAADFNAALTLCPADTMMKNFNSDEYTKTMVSNSKAQSVDEIKSEYTQQTANFALSLLQEEIKPLKSGTALDASWTDQFLKGSDGAKLKDLQALRIDKPYRTGYNLEVDSDVYKESMKNSMLSWSAEDITERIALLQHNGKTYLAGFTLIRYGGVWGVKSVTSAFEGMASAGGVEAMGQEDYLKHVNATAAASK